MTLRVVELFAGAGAQHQALKNLGIPHEVIAISEIDKYAIAAYTAIHGPVNNLGDIRKIEHLPPCDLVTYSFPCQDLSIAGLKKGMAENSGTRSGLLWDVGRLLKDLRERESQPEYLLMENVDAILNDKNRAQFMKWIIYLNELGYNSSYQVINALDHGIPQNRKRCFMVSTLTKGCFRFPGKKPLEKRLKDMLESNPDNEYYLSDDRIKYYQEVNDKRAKQGKSKLFRPLGMDDETAYTVLTRRDRSICNFIKIVGHLNSFSFEENDRVYSVDGAAPTVNAKDKKSGAVAKILVKGGEHD